MLIQFASCATAAAFCRHFLAIGGLVDAPRPIASDDGLRAVGYRVRVIETPAQRAALAPRPGTYHSTPTRAAARAENEMQREHGLLPAWHVTPTMVHPGLLYIED